MMGPTLYCDRARMWASLAVDGEISEVERDSLRAHVAVCPACEAWAAGVVDLAQTLRTAPLAEPSRTLFDPPIRSRHLQLRALQLAAAAAAVAASVGLGHLAASLTSPAGGKAPSRAAIAATQEPYIEQQQLALLGRAAERTPRGRVVPV
ncbi:MAG: zf-HC2 domain-containing protein [Actinobacteria bacterium]|nr:MAG: zf-HC2 domain-containing protein [Actinomycetota bacterium]